MPQFRVEADRRRRSVRVPWDQADALREYLIGRGLSTTVCLDLVGHDARLELWDGVDADRVVAELEAFARDHAAATP